MLKKKVLKGTFKLKEGFAEMLKGGVIMDVVNAKQAKIAEKAGNNEGGFNSCHGKSAHWSFCGSAGA